jgi:hypothetical protein
MIASTVPKQRSLHTTPRGRAPAPLNWPGALAFEPVTYKSNEGPRSADVTIGSRCEDVWYPDEPRGVVRLMSHDLDLEPTCSAPSDGMILEEAAAVVEEEPVMALLYERYTISLKEEQQELWVHDSGQPEVLSPISILGVDMPAPNSRASDEQAEEVDTGQCWEDQDAAHDKSIQKDEEACACIDRMYAPWAPWV